MKMIGPLTEISITTLFERCYTNPNYKVFVAFSSKEKLRDFELRLYDEVKNNNSSCVKVITSYDIYGNGGVNFDLLNGSNIYIAHVNENFHGKRCNEILYDDNINEGTIRYILMPMLVHYYPLEVTAASDLLNVQGLPNEYMVGIDISINTETVTPDKSNYEKEKEDESDALNEFLNGFKIKKQSGTQ